MVMYIQVPILFFVDFCCSSSSPSFQPIRSQISIPTAHVMPSTSGPAPCRPPPQPSEEPPPPAHAGSKPPPLPKSASSPSLEALGRGRDCLSRYRSLVNGLDHSLLPPADGLGFHTPAVEPTLNQSALLGSLCAEPRGQLSVSGLSAPDPAYKLLPEAAAPDAYPARPAGSPGLAPPSAPPPQAPPPHSWQGGAGLDPRWQQLEKLRLQVEQMQVSGCELGAVLQSSRFQLHYPACSLCAVYYITQHPPCAQLCEFSAVFVRSRQ